MVKKFLLMVAMVLTLGLSVQGVAAQMGDDTQMLDPEDVQGLTAGYGRNYAPDMDALTASPSADSLDLSAYMRNASVMAYLFESDDDAKAFLDLMKEQVDSELVGQLDDTGEVTVADISEFDKTGVKVTIDMGDLGVGMTMLVFVDGDTVFAIIAMDSTIEASTEMAVGIAKYVIDADVKDEEITFKEDGTSTGGVFDRMPPSGDDVVGGLKAELDSDLLAEAAN